MHQFTMKKKMGKMNLYVMEPLCEYKTDYIKKKDKGKRYV